MISPFDAEARRVLSFSTRKLAAMYQVRCGIDVAPVLGLNETIDLYECQRTGYRFWRPVEVAGDEAFYRALSTGGHGYYRTERWEYPHVWRHCNPGDRVLEIGCGPGYFLKGIESVAREAVGLELNSDAALNKVTTAEIRTETVERFAASAGARFDMVCAHQVVEHVIDPASFLRSALSCLRPGGLLALSTPNQEHVAFADRADPFDMPPHHMGQFTRDVFPRLGEFLGLKLVEVVAQTRRFQGEVASIRTRQRWSYRLASSLSNRLMNAVYRANAEPGQALLAVFIKPN